MARRIEPTRLAWMAGVIETKGRIRRVEGTQRKTLHLKLQVQTSNIPVVTRLGQMTGVVVRMEAARTVKVQDRRACVDHCPEAHIHVVTEMPGTGIWHVTGVAAAIVLHNLAVFLDPSMSLAVVDEILEATVLPADWRRPGRGAYAIWQTVNKFRTLGWDIPEPLTLIPRKWISEG